jgi:hypothetical protein
VPGPAIDEPAQGARHYELANSKKNWCGVGVLLAVIAPTAAEIPD